MIMQWICGRSELLHIFCMSKALPLARHNHQLTECRLCGFPPFYAPSQNVLFEKILSADYDFPDPEWTHVSDAAKHFIRKLIVKEPEARFTAQAALEDQWLAAESAVQPQDLHSNFAEKMKKYNEARRNVQPV